MVVDRGDKNGQVNSKSNGSETGNREINMDKDKSIKLFENKYIRTHWDAETEKWYFSIVDVFAVLSDSVDSNAYWRKLKQRLIAEGNETVTNCHSLKMVAADGKMRMTDIANTEQLLRLIQSIPSKKAEPFKLWLAQVGSERIDETADPELAIDRALETCLKKGYSRNWINQRLKTIEVRKELTKVSVDAHFGEETVWLTIDDMRGSTTPALRATPPQEGNSRTGIYSVLL